MAIVKRHLAPHQETREALEDIQVKFKVCDPAISS